MTNQKGGIQPQGEKLRQAILWLSEMAQGDSNHTRRQLVEMAEIRFNLSPRECEFLNENFANLPPHG